MIEDGHFDENNINNDSLDNENSSDLQSDKTTEGKLRFPYVVIVILLLFLSFLLYFYFILIKPENLFVKVFKFQFSVLKDSIVNKTTEYDSVNYIINTEFKTIGNDIDENKYLNSIDGLKYLFNIGYDAKTANYKLDISSNINEFKNKDKIKYNEDITSSYYYYNQLIYLKPLTNIIKTDTNGDSSDNTEQIFNLVEEAFFEAIDVIEIENVKRSIATKKVKSQSLIAIKYSTSFNNESINKLYQETLNNLLDNNKHPNFIKNFADNLNITEDEAIDKINVLKSYNIKSKDIKLNYYLNLAFNNLVAFEIEVDDVKFTISYLSGIYFINVDSNTFNFDISYNTKTGDVFGNFIVDYFDSRGSFEFESIVKYDNKHNVTGNDLVIRFYDNSNKPFLIIDNDISYFYNSKVAFFDNKDVISYSDASVDEINKILYIKDKIFYEGLYLLGVYMSNRKEITPVEFVNMIINDTDDMDILDNESNDNNIDNSILKPDLNVSTFSDDISSNNGDLIDDRINFSTVSE